MFSSAAPQSLNILNELKDDLHNERKWLELVNAQMSPSSQIELLTRAVPTVPESELLWTELINRKINQNDLNCVEDLLRDALALFPHSKKLWELTFIHYPSVPAFTTALQQIDQTFVWKHYVSFVLSSETVSEEERWQCCTNFLEFDITNLAALVDSLLSSGRPRTAADLVLHFASKLSIDAGVWEKVITQNTSYAPFLETAAQYLPPSATMLIAPLIAQAKMRDGQFGEARGYLIHLWETSSSVSAFAVLFRALTSLYDRQIEQTMRSDGQGGWKTAQLLTEYSNLLKKRSLLLSNIALTESPHNIGLWLDRARLYRHSPHRAADVLERGIENVNPLRAVNGDIVDLHASYANLLAANGSSTAQAAASLQTLLDRSSALSADQRTRAFMALADLYQKPGHDADRATQILRTALNEFPQHKQLWTHYISVLVETHSEDLLPAFSKCCITGMVTMRLIVLVAQAFPNGSSNQQAVFDKGTSLFPPQISWPIWRHYLCYSNDVMNLPELRALYDRAFAVFTDRKSSYEELVVLYTQAERSHKARGGSLLLARRRLVHILPKSLNEEVWHVYVSTFDGDIDEKRQAYEQAINKLNDREAAHMALEMAKFEEEHDEVERARALYRYASHLQQGPFTRDAWHEFESKHAGGFSSDKIQFVPAVGMES